MLGCQLRRPACQLGREVDVPCDGRGCGGHLPLCTVGCGAGYGVGIFVLWVVPWGYGNWLCSVALVPLGCIDVSPGLFMGSGVGQCMHPTVSWHLALWQVCVGAGGRGLAAEAACGKAGLKSTADARHARTHQDCVLWCRSKSLKKGVAWCSAPRRSLGN